MKQDFVFFKVYPSLAVAIVGCCSRRAAIKIAKLQTVYINDIRIHEYTGRQNNN